MDKLTDRLRGIYSMGPDSEFKARSFADFIPPINLEAANRIQELEDMLIKKLDLIRCGIGSNYSGDPYENEKYVEVVEILNYQSDSGTPELISGTYDALNKLSVRGE